MTRSKFRRAIREVIHTRLNAMDDLAIRELVNTITDTIVDRLDDDGIVESPEDCFNDIVETLNDSVIGPEMIGDEISKAEKAGF